MKKSSFAQWQLLWSVFDNVVFVVVGNQDKSLNFYKYLKAVRGRNIYIKGLKSTNPERKCLELTEARIKTRYDPNWNRKYNPNKLKQGRR